MIKFVWIIIKDVPVAGMKFIKISNQEERALLEKFYGWLSGPTEQFTSKVQNLIIEDTRYYYHSNNGVLFVVGADLEETGIPSVFLPELEEMFFSIIDLAVIHSFDGKNTGPFRAFDNNLVELVQSFGKRKTDLSGTRKDLDAFEVLNLPSELQMVALVLVKLQVVTPDMVSQVSGIPAEEVARQLREIYQMGYLYITDISNKSYFSIKPFGSDEVAGVISRQPSQRTERKATQHSQAATPITEDEMASSFRQASSPKKVDLDTATVRDDGQTPEEIQTAMMAPPTSPPRKKSSSFSMSGNDKPIQPRLEDAQEPQITAPGPMLAEIKLPRKEFEAETAKPKSPSFPTGSPSQETIPTPHKGVRFKEDPIGKGIDVEHQMSLVIPKNGRLPSVSLRREKNFASGKIKMPSLRGKDPFLLNVLFKRDLEKLFEALLLGDFILIVGESQKVIEEQLVDKLFETLVLLTPHRNLTLLKSSRYVHPKDADIVFIPRSLLKYYSWATIIDLDSQKIVNGNSSEFSKDLVKRIRKITDPKELVKEVAKACSELMKVGRDINTLKIEGQSPDLYINEVKKTFGVATLDAGLALSERLIRLYKDCAYIAGFYIRKGLDIIVRAVITNNPIVVLGNDPMDVYHVIEAIAIFAPHKAVSAQIWTTNFSELEVDAFDIIGAPEGTAKLFKDAVKVDLRSRSAYGGPRSQYLHDFLRQMWRRRSKERPKFIRESLTEVLEYSQYIVQQFDTWGSYEPSKQEIKELFQSFDIHSSELIADLIRNERNDIAEKIKKAL